MGNRGHRGWSRFEAAALVAFIVVILLFIWSFLALRDDVLRRLYESYL